MQVNNKTACKPFFCPVNFFQASQKERLKVNSYFVNLLKQLYFRGGTFAPWRWEGAMGEGGGKGSERSYNNTALAKSNKKKIVSNLKPPGFSKRIYDNMKNNFAAT